MSIRASRWCRLWGCAMVAIVAMGTPSHAQPRIADLPVGARIRLWAPDGGLPVTTIAVLDSLRGDSLYLGRIQEPPTLRSVRQMAVPLTRIVQLDQSTGRASRVARAQKGVLWGLGLYALLAGSYIVHEYATCNRSSECFGEGFAWLGLIETIPWAAGIGAAVGGVLPVEGWKRVVPPPR